MTVRISKGLRDNFVRKAKRIFPVEEYAILLGRRVNGHLIEITELFYPDDRVNHQTQYRVDTDISWFQAALQYATANNLSVLGDWHSHCYTDGTVDAAPSEGDWKSAPVIAEWIGVSLDKVVFGLTALTKRTTGNISSRTRFWPAAHLLSTIVTE